MRQMSCGRLSVKKRHSLQKSYPDLRDIWPTVQQRCLIFKKQDELSYYLERIVVYANERSHQDTAVSKYQAYVSKAETLTVQASGALAFASPEILQIDDKRLESFYSESNELVHYKRAIDEIMRQKAHTLSAAEENILAQCGEMAAAPENIFSMFNNADIKFPYFTDVEGNKIRITHGNFIDF